MSSGLSLAITSAQRLRPKMTRKIHSDQYPRRLARKLCNRRRIKGLSVMASVLATREVDAGIDQGVREVADEPQHEADQGVDVERAEHDGVIAVDGGLEPEQ